MKSEIAALVLMTVALSTASVRAQFTEIDISGQVSADLQGYTDGPNYQLGGTQLNAHGVPFALATLGGNPTTTGIVQSPDLGPESFPSGLGGPYLYTFPVPANTHATALYTLINSAFGVDGLLEGTITVIGTGSETATMDLVEGVNIRDHFNGGFVNTLTDGTVVPVNFLGGAPTFNNSPTRLDRQVLPLPASFNGDTIASITFSGTAYGVPGGQAFVAGVTLANDVPDCSLPLSLLVGMFGTMVLIHRSRLGQKLS